MSIKKDGEDRRLYFHHRRNGGIMNLHTIENNPARESRIQAIPRNRDQCTTRPVALHRGKGHSFREDYFIPRLSTQLNSTTFVSVSVSVQLKIPNTFEVPSRSTPGTYSKVLPRPPSLYHDSVLEFEGHSEHAHTCIYASMRTSFIQ